MPLIQPVTSLLAEAMATHRITPRGVVHVGAHLGQEVLTYLRMGFRHLVLVEPQPDLAEHLGHLYAESADITVVEGACAAAAGRATLHLLRDSQLASLCEPIRASRAYDETGTVEVDVYRLADLVDGRINVAVVDAQGSELDVVAGADLDRLDLVILEARNGGRYVGAADVATTTAAMRDLGWRVTRVAPHGPVAKANVFDIAFIPEGHP